MPTKPLVRGQNWLRNYRWEVEIPLMETAYVTSLEGIEFIREVLRQKVGTKPYPIKFTRGVEYPDITLKRLLLPKNDGKILEWFNIGLMYDLNLLGRPGFEISNLNLPISLQPTLPVTFKFLKNDGDTQAWKFTLHKAKPVYIGYSNLSNQGTGGYIFENIRLTYEYPHVEVS